MTEAPGFGRLMIMKASAAQMHVCTSCTVAYSPGIACPLTVGLSDVHLVHEALVWY